MSKLRKSVRGWNCQVRIPGYCNHDPETVVLAHLNGGGMGRKRPDIHGAACCSRCHDVLDRRLKWPYDRDMLELWHLWGVIRTQELWRKMGLI